VIRAQARPAPAAFAARLAAKAGRLAQARTAARKGEHRWRSAAWLWPLFGKDR
jgi:hypothetical protein